MSGVEISRGQSTMLDFRHHGAAQIHQNRMRSARESAFSRTRPLYSATTRCPLDDYGGLSTSHCATIDIDGVYAKLRLQFGYSCYIIPAALFSDANQLGPDDGGKVHHEYCRGMYSVTVIVGDLFNADHL